MAERDYDVAVIGAGILGLATARETLRRWPDLRVGVIEKEPSIAMHQSGHNSGVIHSGIYYAPGSLKARLCVVGARALMDYCDERGIPYLLGGKVIVATDESELPRLEELQRRGIANGVAGLEMIGPDRLREIEPFARGVRALYSPRTGIIDFKQVAAAYADDVRSSGGDIMLDHAVDGLAREGDWLIVQTGRGIVKARHLIVCAGLYSDRLAALTGELPEPRIVPFRGDYYTLRPDRAYVVRSNIYPVPDPSFPFLGIHLTRQMNGEVWLGPNAVLAFAREGYRRLDFNPGELLEALRFRGFQTLARKYWPVGVMEMVRDYSKRAFLKTLQRYVPELEMDDLCPGPSGVRAQALDADGKLVDDFVFHESNGVLHVRNAPSPAATSSLAIAGMIADRAANSFGLDSLRRRVSPAVVADSTQASIPMASDPQAESHVETRIQATPEPEPKAEE